MDIVSSHQYGVAKEHPNFWTALFDEYSIDPNRAVFMDDSLKSWTLQIVQASEKLSKLGTPIYLNHPAPRGNKELMTDALIPELLALGQQ